MKQPYITLAFALCVSILGCSQSAPASANTSEPPKATKTADVENESAVCKYSFCSQADRLYWFSEHQQDSLDGDSDWWQGNRSAEFENRNGHPSLVVGCNHSRFIQAQIKTDGIILESSDSIATVAAKADGKRISFRWPVAKNYETVVLNKSQLRELLKYKELVLGLQDYHGFTYRMILQIPPLTKEMRASCSL